MFDRIHIYAFFVALCVLLCQPSIGLAQEGPFKGKFHLGFGLSPYTNLKIKDFESTIIRREYYDTASYDANDFSRYYSMFGVFATGSPENWDWISFRLGFEYYFPMNWTVGKSVSKYNLQYTDDFQYSNSMNGLQYGIILNYHYLSIPLNVGIHFRSNVKFNFGLLGGVRPMFNLSASNLNYQSSNTKNDIQIRENLRNTLVGKNIVMPYAGCCFIFKPDDDVRIGIDFIYNFNSTDAIETLPNGYNFIDNSNRLRSYGINAYLTFNLSK